MYLPLFSVGRIFEPPAPWGASTWVGTRCKLCRRPVALPMPAGDIFGPLPKRGRRTSPFYRKPPLSILPVIPIVILVVILILFVLLILLSILLVILIVI